MIPYLLIMLSLMSIIYFDVKLNHYGSPWYIVKGDLSMLSITLMVIFTFIYLILSI